MIRHYSRNIQNEILKELFNANKSIRIAVAWSTNDILFQPLLLKSKLGVFVELVTNHDEINISDTNKVSFNKLIEAGGVIHWNKTNHLMHDKFCIIDDKIVIAGSYNWTNKAENNDESISFSYNEGNTLHFYDTRFKELAEKYPGNKIEPPKDSCIFHERNSHKSPTNIEIQPIIVQETAKKPIVQKTGPNILIKRDLNGGVSYTLYKDGVFILEGSERIQKPNNEPYPWTILFPRIKILKSNACIPDEAFAYCTTLESIKIGQGCAEIGNGAFRGCKSLKDISLNGLKTIGDNAFYDCTSLLSVSGTELKEIGVQAFKNCTSLRRSILAEKIGAQAFCNCSSLSYIETSYCPETGSYDVVKEKSIPSFGWSFVEQENNRRLEELKQKISYSAGCQVIGDSAFMGCSGLIDVSLAKSVIKIDKNAFKECTRLTRLYIGDSISSIDDFAFSDCPALAKVRIGKGISHLGKGIFSGCKSLQTIAFPSYPIFSKDIFEEYANKVQFYYVEQPIVKMFKEMELPLLPRMDRGELPDEVTNFEINPQELQNGGSGIIFPGDIIQVPDASPFVVSMSHASENGIYKIYFLHIIRNGKKSWLNLNFLTKCDYQGKPIGKIQKMMLDCKSLKEMLEILRGKTIVGGPFKEYSLLMHKNGIKTQVIRKLSNLDFV